MRVGHAAPIALPADFSATAPDLTGGFLEEVAAPRAGLGKCSYLNSDERYTVDVRYGIGIPQTTDATIEPVDPSESSWLPELFELRSYKIKLASPDHAGVSRVRVTLVDTSAHPGIATNAGMHNRTAPSCPLCTRAVTAETHGATGTLQGLPIARTYHGLNACPLDTLPDLFFREVDNPDFLLVSPSAAELRQPVAQVIESKAGPASDEVVVKVFVADYAASARLAAEVEVGGQWFPVKAIARRPPARDRPDAAARPRQRRHRGRLVGRVRRRPAHGRRGRRAEPGEEGRRTHGVRGYRGIYELGFFERTDPRRKDVFVTDYTGTHLRELQEARALYARNKLSVHAVDGSEFRSDVINWQPDDNRRSQQDLIALMMNPATPARVGWREFANDWPTFAGMASHVNPPEEGQDTVLLQYENKARPAMAALSVTIAHEIGHMIGLPHHGAGDGFIDETPDPSGVTHMSHYAAVRGGQHAGEESCIMRYGVADFLCKAPALVLYSPSMYDPWPQPAPTTYTICARFSGTGINASGAGAGDATAGNCISQVRVKSGQR